MRQIYVILFLVLLTCIGCEWRMTGGEDDAAQRVSVERYDRIESLYLSTGDFAALQQMNTNFPQQTRTLIEDVLQIGRVNDPEINVKFLNFYQDTTLQMLIAEVEQQYASMDDINDQLAEAFERLDELIPGLVHPEVYAQIGSLDQSIIVAGDKLGISLDKYLGSDYPLYLRDDYGYTEQQRRMMTRQYIVPDCLGFYLLSLFPMPYDRELTQVERDLHVGKIQWTVNKAMNRTVFNTLYVRTIDRYMKRHKGVTVEQLLNNNDYRSFR